MSHTVPPFLEEGDRITIVAPARSIQRKVIDEATDFLRGRGFEVTFGKNLFKIADQFAGSDRQRAADINDAIHDAECRMILCARGGYGAARLIEHIDWEGLRTDPKWIVGYSDVTALHATVFNRLEMESIHGSMPINFKNNTIEALDDLCALCGGESRDVSFEPYPLDRAGEGEGPMVGGNLSVLYSLLGSESQIDTRGKILFLEDLDEYLYHVDRMMLALDRAGMLRGLSGLVVGGMTDMNDNIVPFGATAEEIIAERVAKYDFPVAYGFPSGHIDDNRPWRHGQKKRLTVKNGRPSLLNHY